MTGLALWQEKNGHYLHSALRWLRLRLEAATVPNTPPSDSALSPRSPITARSALFGQPLGAAEPRESPTAQETTASVGGGTSPLENAAQALAEACNIDPPPALVMLCRRLELSDFEGEILMLCAAMELDTRMAGLVSRVHGDPSQNSPSFALAMALFDDPAWEALSPQRPLRYWRLLEINQPGAQPLTTSALRADERIVSFIKGLNYLDDRLAPLVAPMRSGSAEELPASQREAVRLIAAAIDREPAARPVVLRGNDREAKERVADAVATELGLHLYCMASDALPAHPGELETLSRLWQRESLLLPVALYVEAPEVSRNGTGSTDDTEQRVATFTARLRGLVFIDARGYPASSARSVISAEVNKPTPAEQQLAWRSVLNDSEADVSRQLSGQFNLNDSEIRRIVARVAGVGRESVGACLWNGCRAATRPALERLAQRIEPKARWDDIVLPPHEAALLRRVVAHVRGRARVYDEWGFRERMNRGLGVSAMFSGESGTGKTMAAEVLANALQLDLCRIDLSGVVSKYIGETEKNLRQVFDAAEDGGAILLFDEADALFGKRSEVKDSHDRYANIEINYLLQRIESYRGLAILATNMKNAIDTAFLRRLRFIVHFPFPGPVERRAIWEKAFPSGTPLGVLDYQRLAKLNLTGGNIHSIALNAAFLAVEHDAPVTMEHVLDAAKMEFKKLERPVYESDFRWAPATEARA